MSESYDLGSPVLTEVTFKKQTPHGTLALYDPNNYPTITVKDTDGTVKVSAQNLTKSSTGKWYYITQTAVNWMAGEYEVSITSTDGTNTDVTAESKSFILV